MNAAIRLVHPAQDDVLAGLRQERATVSDRLAQLAAMLARSKAAEDAEREAVAAIDALGDAELAAMQAWLSVGSAEPAPRPDMETRATLNHRLAEAIAQAATMRAAAAGIAAEHGKMSERLAAINEQIESGAMEVIASKFEAELADVVKLGVEIQGRLAKTYGAVQFMRETADLFQATGRADKATAIFRRLEGLAALPKPEFMPTTLETRACAPAWREHFEGLTK
jgi:hypothetical protein